MGEFDKAKRIIGLVHVAIEYYNFRGLKKETIIQVYNQIYGSEFGIIDEAYLEKFHHTAGADFIIDVRGLYTLRQKGIRKERLEESLRELNKLTDGHLDDFFKKEE
ncbi:hypothetical protein HY498_02515 [Candidatus Woesearchaeota archaeon]|nr:hypothetical protein [Candidatus Woesearchaeota archaeon]